MIRYWLLISGFENLIFAELKVLITILSMKKNCVVMLLCFFIIALTNITTKAQTSPEHLPVLGINTPWTDGQLIEPSALVTILKDPGSSSPLILNIGAVEDIKGATHIGAVSNAKNLEKLKNSVAGVPKNRTMIIYCGCCPFAKCPNIRPAFIALKKMGFTNVKVLDLSTNLKTDWIAKGYPLAGR
jgi:hypothetical protein